MLNVLRKSLRKLFLDYRVPAYAATLSIIIAFFASVNQWIATKSIITSLYTFSAILFFIFIVTFAMQIALEFRNDSLSKFIGFFETKDAINNSWYLSLERLKAIEADLDSKSEIVIVSRYLNYEQNITDSFLNIVRNNIEIKEIKYKYVIQDIGDNQFIRDSLINEFGEKIEIVAVPENDFDYPSDIIYYTPPKNAKKIISLYMELPSYTDWKQRGWLKVEPRETGIIIKGIEKTIKKYKSKND